jgi:hypothetical protein
MVHHYRFRGFAFFSGIRLNPIPDFSLRQEENMPVGTSLSSVKFLRQLSPSPFNDFQASLELPGFLVEVG